ncbi:hypothetical protein Tco_0520590 [Tanacetum coccineum]
MVRHWGVGRVEMASEREGREGEDKFDNLDLDSGRCSIRSLRRNSGISESVTGGCDLLVGSGSRIRMEVYILEGRWGREGREMGSVEWCVLNKREHVESGWKYLWHSDGVLCVSTYGESWSTFLEHVHVWDEESRRYRDSRFYKITSTVSGCIRTHLGVLKGGSYGIVVGLSGETVVIGYVVDWVGETGRISRLVEECALKIVSLLSISGRARGGVRRLEEEFVGIHTARVEVVVQTNLFCTGLFGVDMGEEWAGICGYRDFVTVGLCINFRELRTCHRCDGSRGFCLNYMSLDDTSDAMEASSSEQYVFTSRTQVARLLFGDDFRRNWIYKDCIYERELDFSDESCTVGMGADKRTRRHGSGTVHLEVVFQGSLGWGEGNVVSESVAGGDCFNRSVSVRWCMCYWCSGILECGSIHDMVGGDRRYMGSYRVIVVYLCEGCGGTYADRGSWAESVRSREPDSILAHVQMLTRDMRVVIQVVCVMAQSVIRIANYGTLEENILYSESFLMYVLEDDDSGHRIVCRLRDFGITLSSTVMIVIYSEGDTLRTIHSADGMWAQEEHISTKFDGQRQSTVLGQGTESTHEWVSKLRLSLTGWGVWGVVIEGILGILYGCASMSTFSKSGNTRVSVCVDDTEVLDLAAEVNRTTVTGMIGTSECDGGWQECGWHSISQYVSELVSIHLGDTTEDITGVREMI